MLSTVFNSSQQQLLLEDLPIEAAQDTAQSGEEHRTLRLPQRLSEARPDRGRGKKSLAAASLSPEADITVHIAQTFACLPGFS